MKKLALVVGTLLACTACSTQSKPAPQPAPEQQQQAAIPQMTEREMMEKFKEYSTPGQAHANLQPLVGEWQTTAKMWSEPGKEPEVTKGTASHHWVLGKRFIQQDYKGKFMNQPFQGQGTLGYDNVKKEYVSTWVDSMGTGIMTSEGKFNSANKTIEMVGTFSCPMTEKEMHSRMVTKIIDKNSHVFEMYGQTPDGKEFKNLEITYKRKA